MDLSFVIVIGAFLILLSIVIARLSDNLGVPALVLFLGVGMLAGSEGPGGIYFDNAALAQHVGIMCLVTILFAGGLDTSWRETRPIFWKGITLATLGVGVTAAIVGAAAAAILGIDLRYGFLLGAIISSTDAAAVFSVLRARNVHLTPPLKPLLEFESGSNDPMAVFLTLGMLTIIADPATSAWTLLPLFAQQMAIGGAIGYLGGRLLVWMLNQMSISAEGLNAVLAIAGCFLLYGLTDLARGSGFLAVYAAGLTIGNSPVVQLRTIRRFCDGMAWLGQIAMFLILGLLVFPSHVVVVALPALAIALVLMLVARPLGVMLVMLGFRTSWRESAFVSWVGLRGAVPIIIATFPLLRGVPHAELMFNVIFFTVLSSALVQGSTIPIVARLFGVEEKDADAPAPVAEFATGEGAPVAIDELTVDPAAEATGRMLVELGLPHGCLVVSIRRDDGYIIPSGATRIEADDTLRILAAPEHMPAIRRLFSRA
jgi:potassium/hydrogen antiporter